MKVFFTLFGLSLLVAGCRSTKTEQKTRGIEQGVAGYVREAKGNNMPSPDAPIAEPQPFATTVYVYALTRIGEVSRKDAAPFYDAVHTKLIDSVSADQNGFYALALPPGDYSLFTRVDGRLYANAFGPANEIAPVRVEAGRITKSDILISARASY